MTARFKCGQRGSDLSGTQCSAVDAMSPEGSCDTLEPRGAGEMCAGRGAPGTHMCSREVVWSAHSNGPAGVWWYHEENGTQLKILTRFSRGLRYLLRVTECERRTGGQRECVCECVCVWRWIVWQGWGYVGGFHVRCTSNSQLDEEVGGGGGAGGRGGGGGGVTRITVIEQTH